MKKKDIIEGVLVFVACCFILLCCVWVGDVLRLLFGGFAGGGH